jgi:hypothetical protein
MRACKRSDVLDELLFISKDVIGTTYTQAKRKAAAQLYNALEDTEWLASEEIQRVIDILDNHEIEIPSYPKRKIKMLEEEVK